MIKQNCFKGFKTKNITIGNAISCTPGTNVLTEKVNFVTGLNAAYGNERAARIMPKGFSVPSDYSQFISHLRRTSFRGLWALKDSRHRGNGVIVVNAKEAARRFLEETRPEKDGDWIRPPRPRFVMAQRFIDNHHTLIPDRAYVVRLWAAIAGGGSNDFVFRAYLYEGGLLFFGNLKSDSSSQRSPGQASIDPQNLVVNIFQQNRSQAIDPWSIEDLKIHMEKTTGRNETFQVFWDTVEKSVASALASAAGSVRKETRSLQAYQGGNFEILGIDFVVDESFRPWMIEVNYLPSMAGKGVKCNGSDDDASCKASKMDAEKARFLSSLLRTLSSRRRDIEKRNTIASEIFSKISNAGNCPRISPMLIRNIMDFEVEREEAVRQGFRDLTPDFYKSLQCLRLVQTGTARNSNVCDEALPSATQTEVSPNAFVWMYSSIIDGMLWLQNKISWLFPINVRFHSKSICICFGFHKSKEPEKKQKQIPEYEETLTDRLFKQWLNWRKTNSSPLTGNMTASGPIAEGIYKTLCDLSRNAPTASSIHISSRSEL